LTLWKNCEGEKKREMFFSLRKKKDFFHVSDCTKVSDRHCSRIRKSHRIAKQNVRTMFFFSIVFQQKEKGITTKLLCSMLLGSCCSFTESDIQLLESFTVFLDATAKFTFLSLNRSETSARQFAKI
jgi:hypothetical protein